MIDNSRSDVRAKPFEKEEDKMMDIIMNGMRMSAAMRVSKPRKMRAAPSRIAAPVTYVIITAPAPR